MGAEPFFLTPRSDDCAISVSSRLFHADNLLVFAFRVSAFRVSFPLASAGLSKDKPQLAGGVGRRLFRAGQANDKAQPECFSRDGAVSWFGALRTFTSPEKTPLENLGAGALLR